MLPTPETLCQARSSGTLVPNARGSPNYFSLPLQTSRARKHIFGGQCLPHFHDLFHSLLRNPNPQMIFSSTTVRLKFNPAFGNSPATLLSTFEALPQLPVTDHTSTLRTVHNLGVLYAGQGRLADAERMYNRAATQHPSHEFIYSCCVSLCAHMSWHL
jgi:hypothetical protein